VVGRSCPDSAKQLELDAERSGLVELFCRFDLGESEFQERVNEHLTASAMAMDFWVDPELLAVGAMSSIQRVVQGWHTLRSKPDEIFQPPEGSLGVLNEMMSEIRCLLKHYHIEAGPNVAVFDECAPPA
jgi:hypothetical protein